MKKEALDRATNALLRARPEGGFYDYFPQVWVVGIDICFTYQSALKSQAIQHYILGKPIYKIEELSIDQAWYHRYGVEMPFNERIKILRERKL